MAKLSKTIGKVATICCLAASHGIIAQESSKAEAIRAAMVGEETNPDITVPKEAKECIEANGAAVCWLQFRDGTRCVVANDSQSNDSSTALNCHFSTATEKLHHLPKR